MNGNVSFTVIIFFYLNIHHYHTSYITSGSRLLWMKMLWRFTYKFLCGHRLLFILRKYIWCLFHFLRNYLTLSIFHSHQWFMRIRVALYLNQYWVLSVFLTPVHKIRNFIVTLICIVLMINDVEHLLVCLFSICISSLGQCLSISCPIFYLSCFYFIIEIEVLFIYSGCKFLFRHIFLKYHLLVRDLLVHLENHTFWKAKILILMKFNLFVL